ncbi:hypothetical protein TpMuguga_01g00431 [Theileria parva strain Muguga]|uniref:Uncharacterized protein n=1 Tax=Theileria parva TaxID=5875 RepID=Q4N8N3_THEPA|nr:uncharacterized protein TpMuguga_01g00431 [Theileria parva strain Muguga]EAN33675.1 hypothetical protein TpMuguga_01g00431 [Theileria parva strain Muguga]|eukprot:XP_765958.1 hypothetical protein [Theileria parva strain Muguga]
MFFKILLNSVSFCCCFRYFNNVEHFYTHYPNFSVKYPNSSSHTDFSVNLFEPAEIEAVNPRIPSPKPKPPPIYILDDPLSDFRIKNFGSSRITTPLNITSLPIVQIEHQDKNKLVLFRDGREILSFYVNKLISFLSNYREWSQAYDPEPDDFANLEIYNPLKPNTYYALVFYCAWQSESIALVRAVDQLLGNYYFTRHPPITHKKKRETLNDLIEELERRQNLKEKYELEVQKAKRNNLPIPPEPDYDNIQPVKFTLTVSDLDETLKILEFSKEKYDFNWWMPMFGHIKYNKLVDKAFNELYNTSYKDVKSAEERKKYKLMDQKRIIQIDKRDHNRPVNVNFVFVRLANSMMLSNSKKGLKRHKRFIQCHEKEFRYNEIMLRLLIEQEVYYENMPVVQLFKCAEPSSSLPFVYGSKTNQALPFNKNLTFYKRNPFEISQHVKFGLPTFRKCNHLSVSDDFIHLGNFMNLSSLRQIDSFDSVFQTDLDFLDLFANTRNMTRKDMANIDPVFHALSLMYKFQLMKIIQARPKKEEYIILNPKSFR